jgi:hypothetical protein
VDDAAPVRLAERIGRLGGDVRRLARRQRPGGEPAREHLALDVFHGDEEAALVLADVVGDGDVGRAQHRGRARFLEQAGSFLGIGAALGGEELQRHRPAEARVVGPVHLAHAAASELLVDLVLEDGGADHGEAPPAHSKMRDPNCISEMPRRAPRAA